MDQQATPSGKIFYCIFEASEQNRDALRHIDRLANRHHRHGSVHVNFHDAQLYFCSFDRDKQARAVNQQVEVHVPEATISGVVARMEDLAPILRELNEQRTDRELRKIRGLHLA